MTELIGVCKVFAVPCQKEIALMIRSKRQMQSVTGRIGGHHLVFYISFDDLRDFVWVCHERQVSDQPKGFRLVWKFAVLELL